MFRNTPYSGICFRNIARVKLLIVSMSLSIATYSQNISKSPLSLNLINSGFEQHFPGDYLRLEAYVFDSLKNYSNKSLSLKDFSNKKLIILDFWAKYCTYCIETMPFMQELQNRFGNDIQIILVTNNNKQELMKLFERSTILKNIKLPMIFSDTILSDKTFPHTSKPFHVWLNGNGKVLTTTTSFETNEKNIQEYLKFENVAPITRTDILLNPPKEIDNSFMSLLEVENGYFRRHVVYENRNHNYPKDSSSYSLLISHSNLPKYKIGYRNGTEILNSNKKPVGIKLYQYRLDWLLLYAYKNELMQHEIGSLPTINNAPNKFETVTDTTNLSRFNTEHYYSYEVKSEMYSTDNSREILKQDIANFFGIKLRIDSMVIQEISLNISDSRNIERLFNNDSLSLPEIIESKNKIEFINSPFSDFLKYYSEESAGNARTKFINKTGIADHTPINLTLHLKDRKLNPNRIHKINEDLKKYGLILKAKQKKYLVQIIELANNNLKLTK